MDKRLLATFILSFIVIFAYYSVFPPPAPEVQPEKEQTEQAVKEVAKNTATQEIASELPEATPFEEAERKVIQIENDLYQATIDSRDGVLTSFLLKDYRYAIKPRIKVTEFIFGLFSSSKEEKPEYDPDRLVNMVGDIAANNAVWKLSTVQNEKPVLYQSDADSIKLSGQAQQLTLKALLPSGVEAYKKLTFYPDSYLVDMEISLINRTGEAKTIAPRLNFGAGNEHVEFEERSEPKYAIAFQEEEFERYDSDDFEKSLTVSNARWSGVMSKYFLSAAMLDSKDSIKTLFTPIQSTIGKKAVFVPKFEYTDANYSLLNGQEYSKNFKLYIGPKKQAEMDKFDFHLQSALDLGWFGFLAHPLLAVLRWLQTSVVNWGFAIILLTLIVRTAMFPLAYKGMIGMKRMTELNPRIKTLREKYKNDKEKLNAEIMNFYRKNKVNPMSGCLPLLMQFPIFIALYQALLPAIELRHQPFFLWLTDLSASDHTLVLPVLMGVTMLLQQHMTPTPSMDPNQAKMMKWMPVIMVFFFLEMPSGLVLYWVVSNIFSIFQQVIFNRAKQAEVKE